MYQKISDGFINVESQKEKEKELLEKKKKEEQPMSYFICPVCNNPDLEKCSCEGGYINYYCKMCRFQHINHHHKLEKSPQKVKNVDKFVISKSIRK